MGTSLSKLIWTKGKSVISNLEYFWCVTKNFAAFWNVSRQSYLVNLFIKLLDSWRHPCLIYFLTRSFCLQKNPDGQHSLRHILAHKLIERNLNIYLFAWKIFLFFFCFELKFDSLQKPFPTYSFGRTDIKDFFFS